MSRSLSTGGAGAAVAGPSGRIGPWIVEDRLASGGMGVVTRVRHAETGLRGALKWTSSTSALVTSSFHTEVRALRRADHPQIVSILDHGETEGHPWLVMALVEGTTLRARMVSPTAAVSPTTELGGSEPWNRTPLAPDRRAPARAPSARGDLVSALAWVCEPLAWLHGEGLTHGDLKPDNVMLDGAGVPILLDLGLSRTFLGPEALQLEHRRSGTTGYVAPEVLRGEPFDGRVDLYALGCMLFEVFAGRLPFEGPARAVLQGHLHTRPPRLGWVVGDVPAAVDELVDSLLAKEPGLRCAHADEVARTLTAALPIERCPVRAPRPRPTLLRPALSGRRATVDALLGAEGVVVLCGPPGVGRTRLLWELGHQLERRGIRHHDLRGSRNDPEAFADLVRRLAGGTTNQAAIASMLARVADAVVVGAEHWARVAETLLSRGPAWLLIDDLQHAGELVTSFVRWAAATPTAGLVVVAATTDPGLVRGARPIVVSPLPDTAAAALTAGLLGLGTLTPDPLVERYSRAEGLPGVLVERLEAAVASGDLVREDGEWVITPAGLARTPDQCRAAWIEAEVAEPATAALALVGPEVDPASLVAMGFSEDEVHRAISAGHRHGWLDGRPAAFVSEHLRLELVQAVSAPVRQDLARRVLVAADRGARLADDVVAAAASTCDDATTPERLVSAGQRIHQAGATAVGLRWMREGVRRSTGAARVQANTALARSLVALAPTEALALLEEVSSFPEPDPAARALRLHMRGNALRESGRAEEAAEVLRTALACNDDPSRRDPVLSDLAAAELALGRLDAAREHLDRLLAAPLPASTEIITRLNRALVDLRSDRPEASFPQLHAAWEKLQVAAREEPHLARLGSSIQVALGAAHMGLGQLEEAREPFRLATELAVRTRGWARAVGAAANLALVETRLGRAEAARAAWSEAFGLVPRAQSLPLAAHVRLMWFGAERALGTPQDPAWLEAVEPILTAASHPAASVVSCERAHLALDRGDRADALVHLREAERRAGQEVDDELSIVRRRLGTAGERTGADPAV